jgi:hypothetical protein
MTPEVRTQWIIAAFFGALLVFAVIIGSRCTRQDGDARPAPPPGALIADPHLGATERRLWVTSEVEDYWLTDDWRRHAGADGSFTL